MRMEGATVATLATAAGDTDGAYEVGSADETEDDEAGA